MGLNYCKNQRTNWFFMRVFFWAELLLGAGEIALAMLDEALCVRPASLGHSDERKKHHAEGVIESYCNAVTHVCLSDVWNGPDVFSPPHRGTVRKLLFSDAVVISVLFGGRFGGHSGIQEENIQRCLSPSLFLQKYILTVVFPGWSAAEKRTYEKLFSWLTIALFLLFQVTTSCQTTTNYELVSVIMCMCEFVQDVLDFVYKWDHHRRF